MFETAALVEDCRAALQDDRPSRNVREVLAAALADPGPVIAALGEPKAGGIQTLHRSAELTVLKVLWSPGMVLMPHNHEMWAVIGIYTGREDNILWRRLEGGSRVEAAGARSLGPGETLAMGPEAIHSVINPLGRITGAIHVYGGDFFGVPRSEWDPENLEERPLDLERVLALLGR